MTVHISRCSGLSTNPALSLARLQLALSQRSERVWAIPTHRIRERRDYGRKRLIELALEVRLGQLVAQHLLGRFGAENLRPVGPLALVDQHRQHFEVAVRGQPPLRCDCNALADGTDEAVSRCVEAGLLVEVVAGASAGPQSSTH